MQPPPEAETDAPGLLWLHHFDLIPLLGGWMADEEDDGSPESMWLLPHPAAWLEDAYDNESQRRIEHLTRVAAGDEHPIR